MEEEQTYEQFIEQIIIQRGLHGCDSYYHERHHIIPRCLGGGNEESNMIDLYAKEHFIAHKLLAKENPHNQGLQFAWYMMCNAHTRNQERYKCTPEEYEEAKIAFSESQKGENNPNYGKVGVLSPRYGLKHTEESRRKMSEHHKQLRGEDNPFYGKHHSEDTKKLMREKHYDCNGENNSFYGKHHTEETKQRLSIPVICVETGVVYYGAKEASARTGIDNSSISKCCKGQLNSAGGYHWEYVED